MEKRMITPNPKEPHRSGIDNKLESDIVKPHAPPFAELLSLRRESIREAMREHKLDAVVLFSTREHAGPSRWILGTPCKSDCHYSFITAGSSGVLEMPWRIPGLRPRLVTDEVLIGVAGEHLMNGALKKFAADNKVSRLGVIGDAPFTHLEGHPAEIVDLNPSFMTAIGAVRHDSISVGMTAETAIAPLPLYPLGDQDREMLSTRLSLLQKEMSERKVDAALLYGTNRKGQYARWLTGVPTSAPAEIVMVTPNSIKIFELSGATDASHLSSYPVERASFVDKASLQTALMDAVKDVRSLGVVKEFPYTDLMPLSADKTLVNMKHAIESLMAVKTPQELAVLRHSAQALATLMEESLAEIAPGQSGIDLESALDRRIALCGSTRSFPIGVAADGELRGEAATTLAEPLKSQLISEAVCIDMGIQYGGLVTDATRMGFVGNPPIRAEYERLREVVESVVGDLKPGQTVRDFLRSVQTKLTARGFDASTLGIEELGHGIGFDLHEEPFLVIEEHLDMQFRPGMVVCVEPEVRTPHGKVRVEEMVEITADGAVIITRARGYSPTGNP